MADEIVQAAQAAQDAADTARENAEGVAETVTAQAIERVAAAEQTAQQIADAAIMTALGQRVETAERETAQCRTEIQELSGKLAGMETQLAEIAQRPPLSISTQGQLVEAAVVQEPPGGVDPATVNLSSGGGADQGDQASGLPQPRKRRLL